MRVEVRPVVADMDVADFGALTRREGKPALGRDTTVLVGCRSWCVFLRVSDGHGDLYVRAIAEAKLRGGRGGKDRCGQGNKQNHVWSCHCSHPQAGMRDRQWNTAIKCAVSTRGGEGVMMVVLTSL